MVMLDMITVGYRYKSTKMGFGSCIACINELLTCRRTWGYENGSENDHISKNRWCIVYMNASCLSIATEQITNIKQHWHMNQHNLANTFSRNPRIGIPYVLFVGLQIPLVEPLL